MEELGGTQASLGSVLSFYQGTIFPPSPWSSVQEASVTLWGAQDRGVNNSRKERKFWRKVIGPDWDRSTKTQGPGEVGQMAALFCLQNSASSQT